MLIHRIAGSRRGYLRAWIVEMRRRGWRDHYLVKSSGVAAAEATSAETTAVETASQTTTTKAPAVAASTAVAASAATTARQRFMIGEHQSAGKQRNDGNRGFLPHSFSPVAAAGRARLQPDAQKTR